MAKRKFYATRGCLTAEGETMKEAKATLATMIDLALQYRPLFVECRSGYVIAIAASPHGFDYTIMKAADGWRRWPTCSWGRGDLSDVIRSCRFHVAQITWTHEKDDEAHIQASGLDDNGASELARWIRFQRFYREAKTSGMTDGEAHEWACRAPHQATA